MCSKGNKSSKGHAGIESPSGILLYYYINANKLYVLTDVELNLIKEQVKLGKTAKKIRSEKRVSELLSSVS